MSRPRNLIFEAERRAHYDAVASASAARDERRRDNHQRLRELAIELAEAGHVDLARQAVDLAERISALVMP